jgi:hypothetical protein
MNPANAPISLKPLSFYPPIYALVFQVISSFQVFRLKILYSLISPMDAEWGSCDHGASSGVRMVGWQPPYTKMTVNIEEADTGGPPAWELGTDYNYL